MKHMVVTMLVSRLNLLVLKLFVTLHVLGTLINLLVMFVLVKLFVAVLAVNF